MGLNLLNSANDPICPTYSAGSNALVTSKPVGAVGEFLNDSAAPGQPNGYANAINNTTVGSFHSDWNNGDLTQSVQPKYSNGLLSFGATGLQS